MDERERAEIEILKARVELLKAQAALARYEAGISERDVGEEINPADLTPEENEAVVNRLQELAVNQIRGGGIVKRALDEWNYNLEEGGSLWFKLHVSLPYYFVKETILDVRKARRR